jgi:hypothetical protein
VDVPGPEPGDDAPDKSVPEGGILEVLAGMADEDADAEADADAVSAAIGEGRSRASAAARAAARGLRRAGAGVVGASMTRWCVSEDDLELSLISSGKRR